MTAHPAVSLSSEEPLVDGIVRWWQARIDDRIVRPGTRLPSIRGFAADKRVSRHTVVEAYERLTALGYVEARRGSGFYVRARAAPAPAPRSSRAAARARLAHRRRLAPAQHVPRPAPRPHAGRRPLPARLAGQRADRPERPRRDAGREAILARVRDPAGLPAAAPAALAQALGARDPGRAGADRHHGGRHPRDRSGGAPLPPARRRRVRRRSGLVRDVRALRHARRARDRRAAPRGRPRPRGAPRPAGGASTKALRALLGAAQPDRHLDDRGQCLRGAPARRGARRHARRGRHLRRPLAGRDAAPAGAGGGACGWRRWTAAGA